MAARNSRSDIFADDFSQMPYWWRASKPFDTPDVQLPDQTDVLIIGSGYAGMCCAVELARAGMDVTVVDANDIGSGASSRAAGFTSGRAGVSKQINLESAVGPKRAAAILEEADEAYDHLQNVVQEERIECDFKQDGRFVGAHTPKAFDKLMARHSRPNSSNTFKVRNARPSSVR